MKYSNLKILALISLVIFTLGLYSSNIFIILQSFTLGTVVLLGFLWLKLEKNEMISYQHKFFNL